MVLGRWSFVALLAACAGGAGGSDAGPVGGGSGGAPGLAGVGPAPAGAAGVAPASAGGGGTTGGPSAACVTTGTIEASLRPTNVLFLIDRSASMNCNLPPLTSSAECEQAPRAVDPGQPSKWAIVRAALEQAIARLPPTSSVGISYFSNDDQCGVQSRPQVPLAALDAAHLAKLTASLGAVQPLGGTPIVGGLILAFKHLNPDQNPALPYGNRFVVLLTDGQEGCAADQTARLLDLEMPKARTAAITAFVIGVPGSEVARGFLSRLAFAGGTPSRPDCDHGSADPTVGDCQFDMTRDLDLAAGLTRALETIGGRALSCEFDVPQPTNGGVLDHDKVNVVYTERAGGPEQLVAQDAAAPCDAGANGWQYTDDKARIRLCGAACAAVRRAASIRIALGCKSVTVD